MFSCKKENTVKNNSVIQEKKSIQISIADFIMQEGNLRSANGRSAASGLNRNANLPDIFNIYYMAFSSDGNRVSFIEQDTINNKTTFGVIKDSLVPGTYNIVLIASEKRLALGLGNINSTTFGPPVMASTWWMSMGDVFYKKIPVTVSDSGNVNNLDVTLNRVAGMVELNMLDALPANTEGGNVSISMSPITNTFYVGSGLPGNPYPETLGYIGTRVNQHTFREYLIGTNNTYTLQIRYKDKVTGGDSLKIIENVKCGPSKKTIIIWRTR